MAFKAIKNTFVTFFFLEYKQFHDKHSPSPQTFKSVSSKLFPDWWVWYREGLSKKNRT